MATLEDLLYINDYTLPSLFRRSVQKIQQKSEAEEDIVEPMSDGAALGGGALMFSVSLCHHCLFQLQNPLPPCFRKLLQ